LKSAFNFEFNYVPHYTEGSPNLSADRVHTVPYRTVPYRTVAYRFPRGTVLVYRTAYRTFLTVFRDFYVERELYRDLNFTVLPFKR
jgi:hypothetical protein